MTSTYQELEPQKCAQLIYKMKYSHNGETIADTKIRVAHALALQEKDYEYWFHKFLYALDNGGIPAGRILSNAGTGRTRVCLTNCTVSNVLKDDLSCIMDVCKEGVITLQHGAGTGFNFSTLRPKNAVVQGVGTKSSGPISFMKIFDAACETIMSGGGRRGAQMATFFCHHPDIVEFIRAKRCAGNLSYFNLSILITEEFMQAVEEDADWKTYFPAHKLELGSDAEFVYKYWPITEGYVVNEQNEVLCKVYETFKARDLYDLVMKSTYDYAEPGFLLIDKINYENNLWFCEYIFQTNPCGEQPLPEASACNLGSVDLTKFVLHPFTEKASFEWKKFEKVVKIMTRMLDNVCDISGLPLPDQLREILSKRRHGLGYIGLGSAMTMMCMKYGDQDSLNFTDRVTCLLATAGYWEGVELAKEKGSAPVLEKYFIVTEKMLENHHALAEKYHCGDAVKGNELLTYSNYMQKLDHSLLEEIREHGCRFTHHSSIAPTGTISMALADNASGGIEPSFSHEYFRNLDVGTDFKEKVKFESHELRLYRYLIDPSAGKEGGNSLPDYFVSADDIDPYKHIDVQAAAQKWVDSSISKTTNCATDYPFKEFKNLYHYGWKKGLKGLTTFRFNPEQHQGVLVKEDDLKKMQIQFTLVDGQKVTVTGNQMVEYEGTTVSANNLYTGLKKK